MNTNDQLFRIFIEEGFSKAVEMIEIIKKQVAGSAHPIHKKILRGEYNSKLAVSMALRSRRAISYSGGRCIYVSQ